jgi:hypothetical protein
MVGNSRVASMRRLAAEAVAIFFGVAAALAGQAWFEHRADLRAERESSSWSRSRRSSRS